MEEHKCDLSLLLQVLVPMLPTVVPEVRWEYAAIFLEEAGGSNNNDDDDDGDDGDDGEDIVCSLLLVVPLLEIIQAPLLPLPPPLKVTFF